MGNIGAFYIIGIIGTPSCFLIGTIALIFALRSKNKEIKTNPNSRNDNITCLVTNKKQATSIDEDEAESCDLLKKVPNNLFCIKEKKLVKESEFDQDKLQKVKKALKDIIVDYVQENQIVGMTVDISLNGNDVICAGFGYADVEQDVPCHIQTVLRIGSISKPLTMAAVARLIDQGKLDIEASIHKYLPNYPSPIYNGKEVEIKVRHLLNHTSGIRHYSVKNDYTKEPKKDLPQIEKGAPQIQTGNYNGLLVSLKKKIFKKCDWILENSRKIKSVKYDSIFNSKEMFLKKKTSFPDEALQLFQHDDLLNEPGKRFSYSTHAWTVVGAIIENASGNSFKELMNKVFYDLGMQNTHFETNDAIIPYRARQYVIYNGKLCNSPYVDNSYKYAGGGFVSTAEDIARFGKNMLYSFQKLDETHDLPNSYIKNSTMKAMWKMSVANEGCTNGYGLGWEIQESKLEDYCNKKKLLAVSHSGLAIGGSSVLYIMPSNNIGVFKLKGKVISLLCNKEVVNLLKLASKISVILDDLEDTSNIIGKVGDN